MCCVCGINHSGKGKCLILKINKSTPIFTKKEQKTILSSKIISKAFIRKNRFNQNLPEFFKNDKKSLKKLKESCIRAITEYTLNNLCSDVAGIITDYLHG